MSAALRQKVSVLLSAILLCSIVSRAQDTKEKLDRLMEYFETNEHFNGSVLVARKGSILLAKGYGFQDAAKKTRNTENTLYQVGTNTMQFTAELMLLIDAQGKLSLDDNVNKFIPDYPNGDKITVKNLLTHTAGLHDYYYDTALMTRYAAGITRDTFLSKLKAMPPAFEPDSRFEFSHSNYALLGVIAEKILDRTYEWLVKQRIYNLCGMTHSGFDFAELTDDNKAIGYNYPITDAYTPALATDSSLSFAAGGMYSTVGDLYKWHKTLLEHKLLPKDWQEIGYTAYKNHYAFGWEVTNMLQKKFMTHQGDVSGFSSFIMRQENDDVFIVILENTMQPADDNRLMAENLAKCLYEKDFKIPSGKQLLAEKSRIDTKIETEEKSAEAPKTEVAEKTPKHVKKEVAEKSETLKAYDGEYVIDPMFSLFITHEGDNLYARATGEDSYHLITDKRTSWYKAGLDSKIEFVKEESGKISKLILHEHGRDLQGVKN